MAQRFRADNNQGVSINIRAPVKTPHSYSHAHTFPTSVGNRGNNYHFRPQSYHLPSMLRPGCKTYDSRSLQSMQRLIPHDANTNSLHLFTPSPQALVAPASELRQHTQREKMIRGENFLPCDPELDTLHDRVSKTVYKSCVYDYGSGFVKTGDGRLASVL